MGLDITGIGAIADAVSGIVNKFLPDKTEQEKEAFQLQLTTLTQTAAASAAQAEIDKAEATSTDPLQHWRGGLGWVCVAAFAWTFVIEPMTAAVMVMMHNPTPLPKLDMSTLSDLTFAMLGLGSMHVYQQIKGA